MTIPGPVSTREDIMMGPVGLDLERKRYWAADGAFIYGPEVQVSLWARIPQRLRSPLVLQ